MPKASQSSDKPTALDLLRTFLNQSNIQIDVLPLKTWYDDAGRYVIERPQMVVKFKEEAEKPKKEHGG